MRNLPMVLDSMMQWVASGCRDLQFIDLSGSGIGDGGVHYLLRGCRSLKTIDFHNCHNLTDEAFNCLDSPLLLGSSISLNTINLSNNAQFTSKTISKIASACKNLTNLLLVGVPKVCEDSIIPLARNGTLNELDLSARSLLKSGPSSSIPRFGPRGLTAIGHHNMNLRYLRLDGCSRITDESVIVLARGCIYLEELSMRRCYKVGDKSVRAIGHHCHQLRKLNIASCNKVSDHGVEGLVIGCLCLTDIDLSNVRLTDRSMRLFARYSKRLVNMSFQNCFRITDSAVLELFQQCNLIEKIDLKGCDQVTDAVLNGCHLPFIRQGAFRGSAVSEQMINKLASKSIYCRNVKGKSSVRPLHQILERHNQHKIVSTCARMKVMRNEFYCLKTYQ